MAGNNSGVSINFSARGTDLMSFMDRMRDKANTLTASMLDNARKQSTSARDQIKLIEEEIKALEKKNRTESEGARRLLAEQRDARREAIQIEQDRKAGRIEDAAKSGSISDKTRDKMLQRLDDETKAKEQQASSDYKEELKLLREQDSNDRLQTRLLRENIQEIDRSAAEQLRQMKAGDETLVDAIDDNQRPLETLANKAASEEFKEGREEEEDKKVGGRAKEEGTFSALLRAMAFERVGSLVSGMPNAKNELDFVKPIMSMVGMAIGGLAGNLIDAANVKVVGTGAGNTNFGALGTQLGEKAGEFFGNALERAYRSRDELSIRNYRLQAMSGTDMQINAFGGKNGLGGTGLSAVIADLKDYGNDFKETADMMYKVATARGSSATMGRDAENMIALQQGLGVQEQTTLSLIELQRSSREQNRDVARLVGGVLSAGQNNIFQGDRTFLNEFLSKNFSGLQRELMKSQDHVASGTTFDILRRFDSIGGQFSARDPRSMGLITQVNNSLVNPGSDNLRAMSFMAMRNANPNLGMAGILEEQQKGLSSPTYLKSMLQMIDRLGGDQDMRIMNTAGAFGLQGNIAAARRIYENRQKLMAGSISIEELSGSGATSEEAIRALGKSQTSKYAQSSAEIENAFIKDVASAVGLVGDKMVELFGDMTDQLKVWIIDRLKNDSSGAQNTTKTPGMVKEKVWGRDVMVMKY